MTQYYWAMFHYASGCGQQNMLNDTDAAAGAISLALFY
jgi:hypothetical protein